MLEYRVLTIPFEPPGINLSNRSGSVMAVVVVPICPPFPYPLVRKVTRSLPKTPVVKALATNTDSAVLVMFNALFFGLRRVVVRLVNLPFLRLAMFVGHVHAIVKEHAEQVPNTAWRLSNCRVGG